MGKNKKNNDHPMARRSHSKKALKPIIEKQKTKQNDPRKKNDLRKKNDPRKKKSVSFKLPATNIEPNTFAIPEDVRPGPSFEQALDQAESSAERSLQGISQSWTSSDASDPSIQPHDPGLILPRLLSEPRANSNDMPFSYNQMADIENRHRLMMLSGHMPFPFPVAGIPPRNVPSVFPEPVSLNMAPFTDATSVDRMMRYPPFLSFGRPQFRTSTAQDSHWPQFNIDEGNYPVSLPGRIEARPYHFTRTVFTHTQTTHSTYQVGQLPLEESPTSYFSGSEDDPGFPFF